jgi:hypothetical protein
MLGEHVIKAKLNPFDADLSLYHAYFFEKDETGPFGVGIAQIMRDPQRTFNASVRATIDNAAMSAGPMFEILVDRLAPGEDPDTIAPFRRFLVTGQDAAPAVRSIVIPNNTQHLLALAEVFKNFGDEATAIPAYVQGEQGRQVAQTVGGLSMLMGAANIVTKDTIKNYSDGISKPVVRAFYHWNMQFSDKQKIKGDYDVNVSGASSLVAKELKAQQLEQFAAQTLNPADAPYVDRLELLRERANVQDLNPKIIYPDEQIKAREAAEGKRPDPDMIDAKIKEEKLRSDAEQAGAKLAFEGHKLAAEERDKAAERELKWRIAELDAEY